MTPSTAQYKIKQAGGLWKDFLQWMRGQTIGIFPDGTVEYYDCDVEKFISQKCNPKGYVAD